MKHLLIAVSLIGATAPVSAFAQSPQPASQTSAGQWTPPYGQPVQQLTRAQVYQQLVEAEQDGQLAYLNSTVYAGS